MLVDQHATVGEHLVLEPIGGRVGDAGDLGHGLVAGDASREPRELNGQCVLTRDLLRTEEGIECGRLGGEAGVDELTMKDLLGRTLDQGAIEIEERGCRHSFSRAREAGTAAPDSGGPANNIVSH